MSQSTDRGRATERHDLNDSIAADFLPHEGHKPAGKICCVCGADVANERRYKDTAGRYWCCTCAKNDEERKHPATCPECNQPFPGNELVEFEKKRVCKPCSEKLKAAAKRAAARLAALEEDRRLSKIKYRRMIIAASIFAAVVVAYAIWRLIG